MSQTTLDLAHKAIRLRGLALQLQRGEHDALFAEADVPLADRRDLIVRRIVELAEMIEGRSA